MTRRGNPSRYIAASWSNPGRTAGTAGIACGFQSNAARASAPGSAPRRGASDLGFRLEHLAAAVHAGLEIDMVRTAQLARVLVLDIGRLLERVGGAAHAPPRRRGLFLRHSHGIVLLE